MAKEGQKAAFFCGDCGNESPRWEGRCPACGHWNTMVQAPANRPSAKRWGSFSEEEPRELSSISVPKTPRLLLPHPELNRVLGGGVVPGSVLLLAGDPGIGKSTLLLQITAALARQGGRVLYVSGEESGEQIRMRAGRLNALEEGIYLYGETNVDRLLARLESLAPTAAVVDSVQTLSSETIPSAPGSVAQVRECTRLLMYWAKAQKVPLFLSGHVTKEGEVAGPRVLEHMVDVVLYLEGEASNPLRVLRSVKNRFGSTHEIALLQMEAQGLVEVSDPSRVLLSTRHRDTLGCAVAAVLEGTRSLLVEMQALTAPSPLPAPRRLANGIDPSRLVMLAAVLAQRARLPLGGQDVILNVTGGLRVSEPAADLASALAIASSHRGVPLPHNLVAIGEVGLSGELRWVSQLERRLKEAMRLGFTSAMVPLMAKETLPEVPGLEVFAVATLSEAIRLSLSQSKAGAPEAGGASL